LLALLLAALLALRTLFLMIFRPNQYWAGTTQQTMATPGRE
jgi:hypothetical protein